MVSCAWRREKPGPLNRVRPLSGAHRPGEPRRSLADSEHFLKLGPGPPGRDEVVLIQRIVPLRAEVGEETEATELDFKETIAQQLNLRFQHR